MQKKYYIFCVIIFIGVIASQIKFEEKQLLTKNSIVKGIPKRIVSMAPSITETLFAIGAGERVVGTTRFCTYPTEAKAITNVGGYSDINFETIVELSPEVVILLPEHLGSQPNFEHLKIPMLCVENRSVAEILTSIKTLGKQLALEENATQLFNDITERLKKSSAKYSTPPKVLITVGRAMGTGSVEDIYISGKGSLFDELITRAGGVNVYQGEISYPKVSVEGLMQLNPDIIIDLIADMKEKNITEENIKKDWATLKNITAVKRKHTFVFGEDYVAIPGPRFILVFERLARIISLSASEGEL